MTDQPTPQTEAGRLAAEVERADEPAYRHIMSGSFVKESVLVGTILPEWLRLQLIDHLRAAQAHTEALDVEALAKALQVKRGGRMSDNRGWAQEIAREYAARLAAKADR